MGSKQRIAFLCHPYHRGGVTRWMADAAIAYAREGLEVYFITVEPITAFLSAKGRETLLQLLSKEINTVQIIKTGAGSEFEFGTAEYRTYVYKKLLAKAPVGTPVILSDDSSVWAAATSLHDAYPVIGVLHSDEEQYYELAQKYYGQVAALACVSTRISETTHKRVPGFNDANIHTIPCGINLRSFNPGKSDSKLQLVYVGRISEYQKRTSDLPGICKQLTRNNTMFHLQIIGDGETKNSLEKRFKEDGLDSLVTFCGWLSQEEVGNHLSQSDILILTSDFEGMPIAVMEALAVGCGVVGTRVSGMEDYERHPLAADCLSVYSIGDIGDAAEKISAMATIPNDIRQRAARKLAESEFSMHVCLGKYLSVISSVNTTAAVAHKLVKLSPFKALYSYVLSQARKMKVIAQR